VNRAIRAEFHQLKACVVMTTEVRC